MSAPEVASIVTSLGRWYAMVPYQLIDAERYLLRPGSRPWSILGNPGRHLIAVDIPVRHLTTTRSRQSWEQAETRLAQVPRDRRR